MPQVVSQFVSQIVPDAVSRATSRLDRDSLLSVAIFVGYLLLFVIG